MFFLAWILLAGCNSVEQVNSSQQTHQQTQTDPKDEESNNPSQKSRELAVVCEDQPISHKIAQWPFFYDGSMSLMFEIKDAGQAQKLLTLLGDRERAIGATFAVHPSRVEKFPELRNVLRQAAREGYEIALSAEKDSGSLSIRLKKAAGSPTLFQERLNVWQQDLQQLIPEANVKVAYLGQNPPSGVPPSFIAGVEDIPTTQIYNDFPSTSDSTSLLQPYKMTSSHEDSLAPVIQKIIDQEGWAVVLMNDSLPGFDRAMDKILEYHANFWDASLLDVAYYRSEARAATLTICSQNNDTLSLRLTDNLPDTEYQQALTLQILLPDGWNNFDAEQSGSVIWSGEIFGRARFNGVPDAGLIKLIKKP